MSNLQEESNGKPDMEERHKGRAEQKQIGGIKEWQMGKTEKGKIEEKKNEKKKKRIGREAEWKKSRVEKR